MANEFVARKGLIVKDGTAAIDNLAGTGTRVTTASSTGVLGTLTNGSDTQVLTMVSGSPAWAPASGTGTISSGSQYQLAYYAANGTTVTGTTNLTWNGTALAINGGKFSVKPASTTTSGFDFTDASGTVFSIIANRYTTTGSVETGNLFIGLNSGVNIGASSDTASINNLAIGMKAMVAVTTGYNNMAFGSFAMNANTSGYNNLAIGANAMALNTTAHDNTAIGASALYSMTTGGNSNTAIGASALYSLASGSWNDGFGNIAGYSLTSGQDNLFVGQSAGYGLGTGTGNVIVGHNTIEGAATAMSFNVIIGYKAGRYATGSSNVFIGYSAGYNETGSNKLYIANSSTTTPLIYGDFSASSLTFNGSVAITTAATYSTGGYDFLVRNQATGNIEKNSGSGSFILNQNAVQQTGNFYISGVGTLGDLYATGTLNVQKVFGVNQGIILTDTSSSGQITIGGASSSGFAPMIKLKPDGTIQNCSFVLAETLDSGSLAAIFFDGRKSGGALTTQDVVGFGSYATAYMTITAAGYLKLNTVPGAYATGGYDVLVRNQTTGLVQTTTISAGGGSVTSFSSGNLSPLFTTSVATATTTPALSFALSNAAGTSVFGNFAATSGAPSYNAATADGQFLVRRSGVLTFGTLSSGDIPDISATYLTVSTASSTYQPLDGDLTSLAAASGTNTIYYRSAANTWTAVTIGTGLSFASGTLANTITASSAANPTASVGLTAVNGSASTYMRSDAAPALSQAIAPTWTGQHQWTVARTVASAAGAVLDDVVINASTTTVTGTTGITTTKGFNKVSIYQPTYTDGSAVTITNAATLYIDNAPAQAGSVTITNAYALWIGSGNSKFGGNITASSFIKSGGTSSQFLKADGSSDSSTYLTANQSISLSTDASGSGTTSIAVTVTGLRGVALPALGATAGLLKYTGTGTNTWVFDTNTYLTANQTITLSGDVSGTGTTAITTSIGTNKVTNAMLAQMGANTIKGNNTAGTANAADLTGTQVTAMLDAFTTSLKGLAPASGGGTTNFLRADGTWAAPPGTLAAANPSASIGLTAVNGSASTYMRSDAAPALSQAIAPTWTGQHQWTVARTVASATSAVLDDIDVNASTTTITGTTAITTTTGFNKVGIYRPTYTNASAVTITNAATLYIDNSPLAAGSVTITNSYALWVGSGNSLFGSNVTVNGNLQVGGFLASGTYSLVTETWAGSSSSTNYERDLRQNQAMTLTAGNSFVANKTTTSGTLNTATSGTHLFMAQFALAPLSINANGVTPASVTNAATLYVEGAATGTATITNNYAFWVYSGATKLGGALSLTGISSSTSANVLYYNSTTGAVTYGAPSGGGGGTAPYGQTFNGTTDWTLSGNYYVITVTHSLNTNDIDVVLWDTTSGQAKRTQIDDIVQTGLNAFDMKVPASPDYRFPGRVVVFNMANTGTGGGSSFPSSQVHTSGSTVTVTSSATANLWLTVNPSSALSALTITMPSSPVDGQDVTISFGGTITGGNTVVSSLTVAGNSGQSILQATTPSTLLGGETLRYRYKTANTTWYRII